MHLLKQIPMSKPNSIQTDWQKSNYSTMLKLKLTHSRILMQTQTAIDSLILKLTHE